MRPDPSCLGLDAPQPAAREEGDDGPLRSVAQALAGGAVRLNPHRMRFAFRWLPPLLWAGIIFLFSTDAFSASHTGSVLEPLLRFLFPHLDPSWPKRIHFLVRKGAHFAAYAVLALLLLRALSAGPARRMHGRWAVWTLAAVSAVATLDEVHQSFTRERTASIYDSLIDVAGGSAAVLAWSFRNRTAGPLPRRPGG